MKIKYPLSKTRKRPLKGGGIVMSAANKTATTAKNKLTRAVKKLTRRLPTQVDIDPLPITFDVPEDRSISNSNRSNSNRSNSNRSRSNSHRSRSNSHRSRSNSHRSNSHRSSNQSEEESFPFEEEESEPESDEDEDEESEERPSMHFIITGDRIEGEKYEQPLHNLGNDAKSRNEILYENKTYYPKEDVRILMHPTHKNLQKYFALEKHYITENNKIPFGQKKQKQKKNK